MSGTRLESVSMGKGLVRWRVVTPPLQRRPRGLEKDYEDLNSACVAVKKYFRRDDVDGATAERVEERDPEGAWGSSLS